MLHLTPVELELVAERMAFAMELLESGEPLQACLSRIYLLLPDGTPFHGETMAAHLLQRLEEYDRAEQVVLPQQEPQAFLRQNLLAQVESLPLQEQCRRLYEIGPGRLPVYTGMLTEEARDQLLDEAVGSLLQQRSRAVPVEKERRALLAMVLYTLAVGSGGFLPEGVVAPLDQILWAVCGDSLTGRLLLTMGALQQTDTAVIIRGSIRQGLENYAQVTAMAAEVVPLMVHLLEAEQIREVDLEQVYETLQERETLKQETEDLREEQKLTEQLPIDS